MSEAPKNDLVELGLVLIAAITPFFFMASDLEDMSELLSGGLGIAFVAAVVTIYRTWKGHRES